MKRSMKMQEADEVKPVDGKCPDGYVLSEDGTQCLLQAGEQTRTRESEFGMKNENANFIVDGPLFLKISESKTVRFDDMEPVTVLQNEQDNIQIGSSGEVLVIEDAKIAQEFFNKIDHKDDLQIEEKMVSVSEAIRGNLPTQQVAEQLVEQGISKGSITKLVNETAPLKIRVRRKIRRDRSIMQKANLLGRAKTTEAKQEHKVIGIE